MQSAFKALDGPADMPLTTPLSAVQNKTHAYVGNSPEKSDHANCELRAKGCT